MFLSKLCNKHLLPTIEEETGITKDVAMLIGAYSIELKIHPSPDPVVKFIAGEQDEFHSLNDPSPFTTMNTDDIIHAHKVFGLDQYIGFRHGHILIEYKLHYVHRSVSEFNANHGKWVAALDLEVLLKEGMSHKARQWFLGYQLKT